MLYHVIVNDWGETTYVPTTLGNLLLVLLMLALLAGAVFFARRFSLPTSHEASASAGDAKRRRGLSVRQLTFCAMSIALATVLSNIKLLHLPTGGSITLFSMLIACLPGWFFGAGAGLLTCTAYGILQLLCGPYVLYPLQLLIDYPLAFGALGLSGLFTHAKHGLIKGYLVGVIGRYFFVSLSGALFFGAYAWDGWAVLPYSLVYNGIYLFAEAALTILLLSIPPIREGIRRIRSMFLPT